MTPLHRLALSALAVAGFAAVASAQYPYQPPIRTFTPPSRSYRPPVVEQPVYAPPPVIVQAPPVVVVPARPRVPVYDCLEEFARCFHPCPGHHHVVIVHPVTKQPVEVCFDLPDCKLRDVDVHRRSVEFDYGRHSVEIEFRRDGSVRVRD